MKRLILKTRPFFLLCLAVVIIEISLGFSIVRNRANVIQDNILRDTKYELTSAAEHLKSSLAIAKAGVRNLAEDPIIREFVRMGSRSDIIEVNALLDRNRDQFGARVGYLMDVDGITIAATNRDEAKSFVGKNYGFRPYFVTAMTGSTADYFALGVTSRKRGYYASHPVWEMTGEVIGVVVLKFALEEIEAKLFKRPDMMFLNSDGGVLMAGDPSLLYRRFEPTQDGDATEEAPLLSAVAEDGFAVSWRSRPHLLCRYPIDDSGRQLVGLSSMDIIRNSMLLGSFITLLIVISSLSMLIFFRIQLLNDERQQEVRRLLAAKDLEFHKLFSELTSGFALICHSVSMESATPELVLHEANRSFERIFGRSRSELMGMDLQKLIPDITEPLFARIADIVITDEPVHFDLHVAEISKILEVSVFSTSTSYLAILVNDVTDREEDRQALEIARDKAEAASLAKSSFLANMSHEIRTPMSGIIGMLDLLMDGDLSPKQEEQGRVIQNSTQSLLRIINDVLDMSKIEAGQLTLESVPFDLRSDLHDLVNLFSAQAKSHNLDLNFDVEEALPRFFLGDPVRLRQVVGNLLGNSLKFTKKGSVTLKVRGEETGGEQALIISVSDTGIGISPEQQGKIFQEFSQADDSTTRRFGGTGLGLSISQKLVEKMGGRIELNSEEGVGSEFWFRIELPVANDPGLARPKSKRSTEDLKLKVLLAEDNRINQRVIGSMLKRFGCEVRFADNGLKAVIAVEEETPDLILMDVQMPEMSGLEAARKLREGGCVVPILALTANAMASDRQACLEAGMDDFLTKPVRLEVLRENLERWVSVEAE